MLYYSWEKAWRAACWAALGNATQAQYELQLWYDQCFFFFFFFCYIINEEILTCLQGNLFDNYSADVFQIDANLGYPAAVMVCIILTTSEIFW
jgi:alpha-L-fucosidase 2